MAFDQNSPNLRFYSVLFLKCSVRLLIEMPRWCFPCAPPDERLTLPFSVDTNPMWRPLRLGDQTQELFAPMCPQLHPAESATTRRNLRPGKPWKGSRFLCFLYFSRSKAQPGCQCMALFHWKLVPLFLLSHCKKLIFFSLWNIFMLWPIYMYTINRFFSSNLIHILHIQFLHLDHLISNRKKRQVLDQEEEEMILIIWYLSIFLYISS